jgi:hypothetical protein
MDVSLRSLERAAERLHFDRMAPRQRARIALLHGSLVYRDDRLKGFDAATVIEVIERLDPPRLSEGVSGVVCAPVRALWISGGVLPRGR